MTDEPRRLLRPEIGPLVELDADNILTQYGRVDTQGNPVFKGGPSGSETGLSLILGQVDVTSAAVLVTQHAARPSDLVRHTRVELLLRAGFEVRHDPIQWNGLHVIVRLPTGEPKWETSQKSAFKATFEEHRAEVGS